MQLHALSPRTKNRKNAPVGRGGKRGKTSGRGGKGQTARAGHKIRPEGRDLIKKLPKRRGYGKNRARSVKVNRIAMSVVNLAALEAAYKAGETVSPASLVARGLARRSPGPPPGGEDPRYGRAHQGARAPRRHHLRQRPCGAREVGGHHPCLATSAASL